MQLNDLTYLLQHPESVNSEQTQGLTDTLKSFPYFQALHALQLKGLKQKESYKYNNALKVTAAHTTDRSVLFDYITSEVFNQNEISENIKKNSEYIKTMDVHDVKDISVDKSVTIDDALKDHIRATEGVLDPELFEARTVMKPQNTETDALTGLETTILAVDVDHITPDEKLNIGKPLEFDKTESHSFMEWLKITSFKPIIRDEDHQDSNENTHELSQESTPPLAGKLNMIDKFINENPKIKPSKSTHPRPKLIDNSGVPDNLMTETLARIYLEQKNYDQAIQSYRILSLKYPEKSSFFADQIKAVQELKDNNT